MEKVKLMQEQANEIKKFNTYQLGEWFYKNTNEEHVLYDLFKGFTIDKLMRAKLIGYEVEPEFKEGQWAARERLDDSGVVITQIEKVEGRKLWGDWLEEGSLTWSIAGDIRHATPEEIAEKKERRWWKKHGREVWELKTNDVLNDGDYIAVVVGVDEEGYPSFYGERGFNNLDAIRENFAILCFAEDRKDIKQ